MPNDSDKKTIVQEWTGASLPEKILYGTIAGASFLLAGYLAFFQHSRPADEAERYFRQNAKYSQLVKRELAKEYKELEQLEKEIILLEEKEQIEQAKADLVQRKKELESRIRAYEK